MPSNLLTTKRKILIGVAVVVVIALIALTTWLLYTHPGFTATSSKIAIIILALVLLIMNLAMIFMLWQIIRLIDFLLTELKPVLNSVQQTAGTVRGTTEFVSDEVTNPIIDVSAKAAGIKGSLRFIRDSLMNPNTGSVTRNAPPSGQPAQPDRAKPTDF